MPRCKDPQIGLSMAIRQRRKQIRLSQEALAFRADIHPTWISHLESGKVNPSWGNMRRIALGLEVPLPELAARAEHLEATYGTAPRPQGDGGGR